MTSDTLTNNQLFMGYWHTNYSTTVNIRTLTREILTSEASTNYTH